MPFPFPEDLSNPGKESVSLASPELAGCFFTVEPLGEAPFSCLVKSLSHVRLFATPWTAAYQDPPSMGFSRQKYWSGLPFPFPGDLPNPGIESGSPHCTQMLYCLSYQGSLMLRAVTELRVLVEVRT